jgi:hypothetical protein
MGEKSTSSFETWCERKWLGVSNWALVPCVVNISPECREQVRAAYPDKIGAEVDVFLRIGAAYWRHLRERYHSGQIAHRLATPLQGIWYVLFYQEHIYIDVREHAVPTRVRKVPLK